MRLRTAAIILGLYRWPDNDGIRREARKLLGTIPDKLEKGFKTGDVYRIVQAFKTPSAAVKVSRKELKAKRVPIEAIAVKDNPRLYAAAEKVERAAGVLYCDRCNYPARACRCKVPHNLHTSVQKAAIATVKESDESIMARWGIKNRFVYQSVRYAMAALNVKTLEAWRDKLLLPPQKGVHNGIPYKAQIALQIVRVFIVVTNSDFKGFQNAVNVTKRVLQSELKPAVQKAVKVSKPVKPAGKIKKGRK
jgi:hypothetical protein